MSRPVVRLLLSCLVVLALGPSPARATTQGAAAERDFIQWFDEAWALAQKGRQLEGQAMLQVLVGRVDRLGAERRAEMGERLARALEALRDPASAREVRAQVARLERIREANAAFSRDSDASRYAGDLLAMAKGMDSAPEMRTELYKTALAALDAVRMPTGQMLHTKAKVLLALGDVERAEKALDQGVERGLPPAGVGLTRVQLALARNDLPKSARLIGPMLAGAPALDTVEVMGQICRRLRKAGQPAEAERLLGCWPGRDSFVPGACASVDWLMAERAEDQGRHKDAFEAYAQVFLLNQTSEAAIALARLARTQSGKGATQLAEVAKRLSEVAPPGPYLHENLLEVAGDVADRTGDLAGALAYYQVGISLPGPRSQQFAARSKELAKRAFNANLSDESLVLSTEWGALLRDRAEALAADVVRVREKEGLDSAVRMASACADALSPLVAMVDRGGRAGGPPGRQEELAAIARRLTPEAIHEQVQQWSGIRGDPTMHRPQRTALLRSVLSSELGRAIDSLKRSLGHLFLESAVAAIVPPRSLSQALRSDADPPVPPPRKLSPQEERGRRVLGELESPQEPEPRRLARVLEVSTYIASPIVIDLDGDGVPSLSPASDPAGSVRFDLGAAGSDQRIQWLAPGRDGWLCEDVNGDGQISSGLELFGTAGGFSNGYEKLALRDANHDGSVSGGELAGLSVWIDRNGDGKTDPGELVSVERAGVQAIALPAAGLESTVQIRGATRACFDVYPVVFGASR